MIYSTTISEVRPYSAGVLINVRNEQGRTIGEIHASRRIQVSVLELKQALKECFRENEIFDDLVARIRQNIKSYASTLEIKFFYN